MILRHMPRYYEKFNLNQGCSSWDICEFLQILWDPSNDSSSAFTCSHPIAMSKPFRWSPHWPDTLCVALYIGIKMWLTKLGKYHVYSCVSEWTGFQPCQLNQTTNDVLYYFDCRFTDCYMLHAWTNCDMVQSLVVCVTVTVFSGTSVVFAPLWC